MTSEQNDRRPDTHGAAAALEIRVECYAGYRGEESPRKFLIGEREIIVEEALDRWLDPDHRYFKVRGDDGGIYILRHDTETNRWEMTPSSALLVG